MELAVGIDGSELVVLEGALVVLEAALVVVGGAIEIADLAFGLGSRALK